MLTSEVQIDFEFQKRCLVMSSTDPKKLELPTPEKYHVSLKDSLGIYKMR